jgi:hypothetical protein
MKANNLKLKACRFVLVFGFVVFSCASVPENKVINEFTSEEKMFVENQISFMDEIIKLHKDIRDVHVSLKNLYPITVVNNGYFYVFDINEMGTKYEFKQKAPSDMSDEMDWLASFTLEFYGMKPSAVIGKNILENRGNYPSIFHEFVHCFQWNNGEQDIRQGLTVQKQEMEKNNYSWELNYPFPYGDNYFIEKAIALNDFFEKDDYGSIVNFHQDMKTYLSETEFEYMIWQEWKEGFARYIENLVRTKLEIEQVTKVLVPPFDRTHFYAIGSKHIAMIINRENTLSSDIEQLFYKIRQ